jgi:hypothetical protein
VAPTRKNLEQDAKLMGMSRKCWLIGERSAAAPILAEQFARLRGLEVRNCTASEFVAMSARTGGDPLIATNFATFDRMSPHERETLGALVNSGATLYIRGAAVEGNRYRLAPLVESSFTVGCAPAVPSYRFTRHPLIPVVLRGEKMRLGVSLNFVRDMSGPIEPIIFACHDDGTQSPVVFTDRCGKGAVICDVQAEDATAAMPVVWRLADPVQRCINIGALIAADRASARNVSKPVSFNLTIDDIPLGYDYFNEAPLEDFLAYAENRCPGVHFDCAWIPSSQQISRRYLEILKHHRAGFLWHGMLRHIDHQKLEDPRAEMEAGKLAMEKIARSFKVQLQPMMIFPFERSHRSTEELLLEAGFLGAAEQPRHDEDAALPEYLRYSAPWCAHESGLRFLHRYESTFLTRDRMIAIAALGMPILAFGHPKDVRLGRLARFMDRGGTFAHFDELLDFATAKSLRDRSLEETARDLFEESSEAVSQLQCA